MNIPFIDLKAQFRELEDEIRAGIDRVLTHGQFIMGPEVGELEAELARYSGVKHVISCSSGTDALLMSLMTYGVGPGDAIFTTTFTFVATAEVISLLGATPVFVDIDPRTFNIDPEKLAAAIGQTRAAGTLRPRGVITVDLFGLPADYDSIAAVADENGMFVLEDAAQSFGALYKGRFAGSLGNVAATSFFPAKPLGCYGDGGAVLTDDDELAAHLKSIRVHGQGSDKYENVRIGINGRLDTLQAAILLPKLKAFRGEMNARQRVAERYSAGLGNVVETPYVPDGYTSAWAQYSVLCDNRDHAQAALKAAGIPTAIYYPKPLHLQGAYAYLGQGQGTFPESERAAQRIISLPFHPYLDEETQRTIIDAVSESTRVVSK
ncbi:MAG: DegT/DnrJ/EryC1/StrS family aminotransferase [Lysobacterales bacterium]|nr:MAG: DegT/DnrJ/EryC1/StrS family aminotransferase [Xanthomonadales bacterium]